MGTGDATIASAGIASAGVARHADIAATTAAGQWGLPEPTLLRRGGNAVYSAGPVIVRVSPDLQGAQEQRQLCGWLAQHDYPVLTPIAGLNGTDGPVDVSAWPRVDTNGMPDLHRVGTAIRRLHQEPKAVIEAVLERPLRTMFPGEFDKTRERLTDNNIPSSFDRRGLGRCLETLDSVEEILRRDQKSGIVHGDLQATNILAGKDGTWLCDFELIAIAPPAWDLAKLAMFAQRFDPDGWWDQHLSELYDGYGTYDGALIGAWTSFALVATTAGCIAKRDARPELGQEGQNRLRWWAGAHDAPWWQFL